MNLNTIVLLFISTIFLNSCADYKTLKTKQKEREYYSSKGFALIYDDSVYLEKYFVLSFSSDLLSETLFVRIWIARRPWSHQFPSETMIFSQNEV